MAYRDSVLPVSAGGTGASTLTGVLTGNGTSPVTAATVTAHGVLIGGTSNAVGSTAVGSATQVLTSNGPGLDPTFQNASAGITVTQYDAISGGSGNTLVSFGPGTAGQVYQSAGAGANPAYSSSTYPLTNNSGDLIYGSSSNAYSNLAIATLPGQFLNYNGTNVNWFNPLQESFIFDDFISAQVNGSGGFGNANIFKSSVSGTGAAIASAGDSGHPGVLQLATGTTTTGQSGLLCTNSNTTNPIIVGGGIISITMVVKIEALSNGTDTFYALAGLCSNAISATPVNGIFFSYNDDGSGGTKPNWFINTVSNSVATNTSSGVAAGTGWTTLRMDINAAGTSITYYINGSSVGTISAHIPTTNLGPQIFILKSAGTTSRNFDVDLFYFYQKLTSAR